MDPVTLGMAKADAAKKYASNVQVFSDWTDNPDGVPTVMDSGHALQLDKNSNPLSGYQVISGKLTSTSVSSTSASYLTATSVGANIGWLGGEFVLNAGGTAGGAMLIVWRTRPGAGGTFPSVVPDSPCHLQIFSDRAVFGVFSGGSLTDIKTITFAAPLPTDGVTRTRVEVFFVRDTAFIFLPGSWTSVTDSRISSLAGQFPCWEILQTNAATESKASWLTMWASAVDYRTTFAGTLFKVAQTVQPANATNVSTGGSGGLALAGIRNTASGTASAVIGGTDNLANQSYSIAQGLQAKTLVLGDQASSSGMFSVQGDAQVHRITMRGQTTDATPKSLGVNASPTITGSVPVSALRTHRIRVELAASQTNTPYAGGGITLNATVHRNGGSPSLVASTVVVTKDDLIPAAWGATIVTDTATNVWTVQVTGEAAKNINWVAAVTVTECG